MNNLVSIKQLQPEQMIALVKRAAEMKEDGIPRLDEQYYISNLFFEPSTRTKTSFEMAERRLGLEVVPFDAGFSSALKGETLYDTVKTLEAIGLDALVIRHEEDGYYEKIIGKTNVTIINGGDGSGQHPSQSLLDLFTIYEQFGSFEGLNVLIAGDVSHSRVARSNADALTRLGANVHFLCPPEWKGEFEAIHDWDDMIETCDVVMLLRVQHERHDEEMAYTKEEYHERFGLTVERERQLKEDAIIMHPAPVNRGVEIASELIESPKSRIFTQVENGVYVRAAIIEMLLHGRNGR